MKKIVVLEDHTKVAEGIVRRLRACLPGDGFQFQTVNYKDDRGIIHQQVDVASVAADHCADDQTVFLVDLAPDIEEETEYGLAVLKAMATQFLLEPDMAQFLKNVNFLVVIVTNHKINNAKLVQAWGEQKEPIEIRKLLTEDDVECVLRVRRDRPILPVVLKPAGYGRMADLVSRWLQPAVTA